MRKHLILTNASTLAGLLLTAIVMPACTPGAPDIEHIELHTLHMNRIPAGHLPAMPGHSKTSRQITLPSFFISATEITRAEYAGFLTASRYPVSAKLTADGLPADTSGALSRPHHPVTHVTLQDARAYCRWLADKTGEHIALPTEQEWEYAARAGIRQAPFAWGWGDPDQRAVWNTTGPAPVGRFAPNGFGLYDMCGNVYEWCEATGPLPEGQAVLRGGAWTEKDSSFLRVDRRTMVTQDYQDADAGFRVVMHPKMVFTEHKYSGH